MSFEYRGLKISPVSPANINKYLLLFKEAFPEFDVSFEYLEWLYFQNPNGFAVGFDAHDGDMVVSHYVCIPVVIDGFNKPCLLALNTATHPKYQGRGLLKVLANKTYESYEQGFSCVVGVANSKAIKPLTKHLGFEHLGDLQLRFGFLASSKTGRRIFTSDEIEWRQICPGRPLKVTYYSNGMVKFRRRLFGFLVLSALSPLRGDPTELNNSRRIKLSIGVTVDWRKEKKPLFFLPKKFKPSPLSLVFRPLSEDNSALLRAWTFPDFDAL